MYFSSTKWTFYLLNVILLDYIIVFVEEILRCLINRLTVII